jgi:hypothetical protein
MAHTQRHSRGMTPERISIFESLMACCKDPAALRAMAKQYYREGCRAEAGALLKRAEMRDLPVEVVKARREAFKKGMQSMDPAGIAKLADAYRAQGCTGAARDLMIRANTLRDMQTVGATPAGGPAPPPAVTGTGDHNSSPDDATPGAGGPGSPESAMPDQAHAAATGERTAPSVPTSPVSQQAADELYAGTGLTPEEIANIHQTAATTTPPTHPLGATGGIGLHPDQVVNTGTPPTSIAGEFGGANLGKIEAGRLLNGFLQGGQARKAAFKRLQSPVFAGGSPGGQIIVNLINDLRAHHNPQADRFLAFWTAARKASGEMPGGSHGHGGHGHHAHRHHGRGKVLQFIDSPPGSPAPGPPSPQDGGASDGGDGGGDGGDGGDGGGDGG